MTGDALPPAFVDRQGEMERVGEALRTALEGRGQLLLLRGEPGIGKTRLAQEVVAEARRRGFAAGFGSGVSESVSLYQPWRETLVGLDLASLLEDRGPPRLLALFIVGKGGKIHFEQIREGTPERDREKLRHSAADFARETKLDAGVTVSAVASYCLAALRHERGLLVAVLEGEPTEIFLEDVQIAIAKEGGTDPRSQARLTDLLTSGKYDGVDYLKDDPKLRQARLFENVALGLSRAAARQPLLLVLDDLQWADPSSLALLQYVVRNTGQARLLILGAYRVEGAAVRPHLQEALQKMGEENPLEEIDLHGVPREFLSDLVAVWTGPHALPPEFLDRLWTETEGNPLFVREVLRGLEEDGSLALGRGKKRLLRPLDSVSLPRRVRDVIRDRLARLSKADRELLDAASACGSRFTASFVAQVSGREEATVLRGLHAIAHAYGLLRATASGYAFNHGAIQEVVYEGLAEGVRLDYHRAAARWLELVGGPAEEIAEHYYRADDARAIPRLREAAEGARARYANPEAIRFYREALSLEENAEKRLELLESLGSLSRLVGDYAASLAAYDEALGLSKTDRDRARMSVEVASTRERIGEYDNALAECFQVMSLVEGKGTAEEALLLATIGKIYWDRGDFERSLQCNGRSLDIREKIGDQKSIAKSLDDIGMVYLQRGDRERALEYLRRSLDEQEKIGDQHGMAASLNGIGIVLQRQGDNERALEHYDRTLTIMEKIGDRNGIASVLCNIGVVHEIRRDHDRALEYFTHSLALNEEVGDRRSIANLLNNIGTQLADRGEYDRAMEHHVKSLGIREKIGDRYGVSSSLHNIGTIYANRGDYDRAMVYFRKSLDIIEIIGDQHRIAMSLDSIGCLYSEQGEYDQALEYFRRCLNISEEIGDQASVAHAASNIADALLRKTEFVDAERHLTIALSIAAQIGDRQQFCWAKRVSGVLRHEQKRWEESAADFDESLQLATQFGDPLDEGKVQYEFGLMWKDKGERERAKQDLLKAMNIFERIGSRKELERARSALQDLL